MLQYVHVRGYTRDVAQFFSRHKPTCTSDIPIKIFSHGGLHFLEDSYYLNNKYRNWEDANFFNIELEIFESILECYPEAFCRSVCDLLNNIETGNLLQLSLLIHTSLDCPFTCRTLLISERKKTCDKVLMTSQFTNVSLFWIFQQMLK